MRWDIWVRWNGYIGIKKLKVLVIVEKRSEKDLSWWDRDVNRESRSPMYWSQWEQGAKRTCSSWNKVTERTGSSGTERLNRLVTVDWLYWDKEAKLICFSGTYGLDVNGYSGIKRFNSTGYG